MRLSDWRTRAPHRESLTPKVVAVIEPVLLTLGAGSDPSCWIVWGDDPAIRYQLFAPTAAGLVQVHVRVNVPQEGPRASGKVVRWNRVQLGELAVEIVNGHRLLTFQAEGQVLNGTDADADQIAAFALELFAHIDGRPIAEPRLATTAVRSAGKATGGKAGAGKPEAAPKLLEARGG